MLCIKLVNYRDKYTEMHGQQNIKKIEIVSQYAKKVTKILPNRFLEFSTKCLEMCIIFISYVGRKLLYFL